MQGARRTLALHAQPRPLVTDGSALAGDVPTIKAILIVDGEGKRIMARYYGAPEFPSSVEEASFEKKLYDKTMRTNAKNEGAPPRPELEDGAPSELCSARQQLSCPAPQARVARPPPERRGPAFACLAAAEVIMFDNIVTVYRNSADVW
jgi:hypothetical protein